MKDWIEKHQVTNTCFVTGIVQKASRTLSRELRSGVLDDSASLTGFEVGKGKVEDGGDGAILAAFLCYRAKMHREEIK